MRFVRALSSPFLHILRLSGEQQAFELLMSCLCAPETRQMYVTASPSGKFTSAARHLQIPRRVYRTLGHYPVFHRALSSCLLITMRHSMPHCDFDV